MDVPRMDRSLGELFSDLSQQTAELIRQEMRLAKAELSEKLSDVGRHAAMIAAAAVFGLAALMAVTAGIVLLLIEVGVDAVAGGGDHRRGDGPRPHSCSRSRASRRCARRASHPSKPCIPSRRRPSG